MKRLAGLCVLLAAGLLSAAAVAGVGVAATATAGQAEVLRLAAGADQAELLFWQTVKSSEDPALYQAYLEQYPNGVFASIARLRLAKLRGAGPAAPPAGGSARLTVRASVNGAQIFVGKEMLGKNEISVDLAPGRYKVRVQRPGYQSEYRKIILSAGEHRTLEVELYDDGLFRE